MLSTDKPEFEVQLTLLCQGYGFWLGDRLEAYWKGLSKMHLSSFVRCIDFALSEDGPEKIPNVHGIWKIHREMRERGMAHIAKPSMPAPAENKWLRHVNGLFLKYLARRRLTQAFKGDLNIGMRRSECLSLAKFFEGLEMEGDSEATVVELRSKFYRSMDRIQDAA